MVLDEEQAGSTSVVFKYFCVLELLCYTLYVEKLLLTMRSKYSNKTVTMLNKIHVYSA